MAQTVKVIFPDGQIQDMDAYVQRSLFFHPDNAKQEFARPEDHPMWDFYKLKSPRRGAEWIATHAIRKKGNENDNE